jgi:hypothetical protein
VANAAPVEMNIDNPGIQLYPTGWAFPVGGNPNCGPATKTPRIAGQRGPQRTDVERMADYAALVGNPTRLSSRWPCGR